MRSRNGMKKDKILVEIEVYPTLSDMDKISAELIDKATKACENAYAPYSNFHVGAALLLENGEVITGNNQENAAYPSGLCAERVALFYAGANFPNVPITKIAVVARKKHDDKILPVSPCGSCRQVMVEYEKKQEKALQIILKGADKSFIIVPFARDLLPLAFDKDALT
jgi:cytidine deaminase